MSKKYRIPKVNSYDTDKLTDAELVERGLEPHGITKERKRRRTKKKRLPTCIYCKKPVKNPITSFAVGDEDILDGRKAHQNCAVEAMLDLLTS